MLGSRRPLSFDRVKIEFRALSCIERADYRVCAHGLNRPSLSMGGYVSVEEYDYKQVTAYVRSRQMPDGSKRISSAEVVWKARKCK
jgi:hypothetical protein